ncbi:hypothetical protein PGH26_02175 [Sporosarcina jeotgali]|uniref:Cyclic lactone autoinducer peptide n=1 Tax=Sporosarcina jeotgali TaxID=3020056 RepID=A0ABZ0KXR8_9BACL|nr:hypothetical protein [Sporosarcina sp. B2O-1]WOV84755.1 hypothetical protein PGH26_02175 [Sporosarcina sp. B2O-1]
MKTFKKFIVTNVLMCAVVCTALIVTAQAANNPWPHEPKTPTDMQ